MRATAEACANIALVKYWGKRDRILNLPQNGSISLTLDALTTRTTVAFDRDLEADLIILNDQAVEGREISRFIDRVREIAMINTCCRVESVNRFPTAAGLASSASGYAALALAATTAAGLRLTPEDLSRLARRGSGSACRSLFGGFAEWRRGEREDGEDSYAVPLADESHWDLAMLVVVLSPGQKATASRDGMNRTVDTSPFYDAWLATIDADLAAVRQAIAERDFHLLGRTAEANCLKMHATMLGAKPPLLYWVPETLAVMQAVWQLRESGANCYFTIDAGPNVKVLCLPEEAPLIAATLRDCSGIQTIIPCKSGPAARLIT